LFGGRSGGGRRVDPYGARWKIEAGFREIKQEIGSAETQTRNPDAVTNHQ